MTPEEQAAADRGTAAADKAFGSTTPPHDEVIDDPAKPTLIDRAEADKAFKARDQAKRERALLCRSLGIDPGTIKLVPTGDEASPFKLDGGDELNKVIAAVQAAQGVETPAQQQAGKQLTAHEKWIERQSIDMELRQAFAAAGAVDSLADGTFSDLVKLTRGQLKAVRSVDDAGELTVTVQATDPTTGEPITDEAGNAMGVDAIVKKFLAARPALQKTQRRSGPGAGGYGNATAKAGGKILTTSERGEAAADMFFGPAPARNAGDFAFGRAGRMPGSHIHR